MKKEESRSITSVEFSAEKYHVLFNWYAEWVRICKLIATVSFGAIILSISMLDLGNNTFTEGTSLVIKMGWILLSIAGLLVSASIGLAYIWLDYFTRSRMPSLVGKAIRSKTFSKSVSLGHVGWITSIMSVICMFLGMFSLIIIAWRAV